MNIQMERRLASFVDWVTEMDHFREMLETREKPIMAVWGDAGLGKTSLFYRMIHECAVRKLRKSEVVWTDTRNHTYVDVMSKIRDDVGVDHFEIVQRTAGRASRKSTQDKGRRCDRCTNQHRRRAHWGEIAGRGYRRSQNPEFNVRLTTTTDDGTCCA